MVLKPYDFKKVLGSNQSCACLLLFIYPWEKGIYIQFIYPLSQGILVHSKFSSI
jgi:hypothetical protein